MAEPSPRQRRLKRALTAENMQQATVTLSELEGLWERSVLPHTKEQLACGGVQIDGALLRAAPAPTQRVYILS